MSQKERNFWREREKKKVSQIAIFHDLIYDYLLYGLLVYLGDKYNEELLYLTIAYLTIREDISFCNLSNK